MALALACGLQSLKALPLDFSYSDSITPIVFCEVTQFGLLRDSRQLSHRIDMALRVRPSICNAADAA